MISNRWWREYAKLVHAKEDVEYEKLNVGDLDGQEEYII